jgi:hypothetical protein
MHLHGKTKMRPARSKKAGSSETSPNNKYSIQQQTTTTTSTNIEYNNNNNNNIVAYHGPVHRTIDRLQYYALQIMKI